MSETNVEGLSQHLHDMEKLLLDYAETPEQKAVWGRWFDNARSMLRSIEADREGREGVPEEYQDYEQGFDDGWWKGLSEGNAAALEGYEERWAVVNGRCDTAYLPGDMSHENTRESAEQRAHGINLDMAGTTSWRPVKLLVPASPEPDEETP